jgi:hypothetical protein
MLSLLKTLIFVGVTALSTACLAGPLGLEKGMTLQQLGLQGNLQADEDPNWYGASSLKSGHQAFERYKFLIDPELGLCKVIAVGKTITTNSFGEGIRNDYEGLASALTAKYGPGKKYDFLRSGSIWDESKDFMMGLLKKDRTLATFWINMPLPDQLASIGMQAYALSGSTGWITLNYEFKDAAKCVEKSKAKTNGTL